MDNMANKVDFECGRVKTESVVSDDKIQQKAKELSQSDGNVQQNTKEHSNRRRFRKGRVGIARVTDAGINKELKDSKR